MVIPYRIGVNLEFSINQKISVKYIPKISKITDFWHIDYAVKNKRHSY